MSESPVLLALLSLIGVCLVLMTITIMLTAHDVRQTLRRLQRVLPSLERAAREASLTLAQTRRLIAHASTLSALLGGVTERASSVMNTLAQAWTQMKRRTQHWVEHSFGKRNGARGEPRRRVRR